LDGVPIAVAALRHGNMGPFAELAQAKGVRLGEHAVDAFPSLGDCFLVQVREEILQTLYFAWHKDRSPIFVLAQNKTPWKGL